jgi:comEA protein
MTSSEKKALLIVTGTLLLSLIVQWIRPHIVRTELYDYSMEDSLFRVLSADTTRPFPYGNAVDGHSEGAERSSATEAQAINPININTAGQKELEKLPRIGPATARRILEYRSAHGSFPNVESLTRVRGIGPKTLARLKPLITVETDSL